MDFVTDDVLTVRDHSQPCEHGISGPHTLSEYGSTIPPLYAEVRICPGGREIEFEKWNDWCWAHDREPHGPFNDACLMHGYRGDCDIRPMYELVVASDV